MIDNNVGKIDIINDYKPYKIKNRYDCINKLYTNRMA